VTVAGKVVAEGDDVVIEATGVRYEMSRQFVFYAGALVLLFAVVGWRIIESSHSPEILVVAKKPAAATRAVMSWREPEADLKLFFPEATRYELESRILSGLRLELAERLGRTPTGDENALHVYRIYRDQTPRGSVLTRRAKAAFGAIEIVLATDTNGAVCGLRLQRSREPESIGVALLNPAWLRSFEGRRGDGSVGGLGADIPDVAQKRVPRPEAIAGAVRSLLILLAVSDESRSPARLRRVIIDHVIARLPKSRAPSVAERPDRRWLSRWQWPFWPACRHSANGYRRALGTELDRMDFK